VTNTTLFSPSVSYKKSFISLVTRLTVWADGTFAPLDHSVAVVALGGTPAKENNKLERFQARLKASSLPE